MDHRFLFLWVSKGSQRRYTHTKNASDVELIASPEALELATSATRPKKGRKTPGRDEVVIFNSTEGALQVHQHRARKHHDSIISLRDKTQKMLGRLQKLEHLLVEIGREVKDLRDSIEDDAAIANTLRVPYVTCCSAQHATKATPHARSWWQPTFLWT